MVGFAAQDPVTIGEEADAEVVDTVVDARAPVQKAPPKGCLKKSALKKTVKENADGTTGSTESSGSNDENEEPKERLKMKARFGSVRVAWHRMTLGSAHPGQTEGVPVTLGEYRGLERYSSVNRFSQEFHYDKNSSQNLVRKEKKKLERLTVSFRRNVALEGHTVEELEEVEKEVTTLVGERKESSHEAEIANFIAYKKAQREAAEAKLKAEKAEKKPGLFSSCLGR